ncbi:MAG: type II toxin-antitoxin system prevent-host-death family antitoxin [Candidatus Nitronauta litoralis]|uniref:Type II toxin-antitoxin system prevent-host-death family antitoxin n=1 Tax=Candidatus Nitronauta litoralis TaxID=2705533 RepID=A0A7T0BT24_9BACT|nr:MAG: type II toxin-antitoxin system prevent-host-death family antitoxin [Candidatus Nitronauta litoralis]
MEWILADAKNRFSELVNKAMTEGPQLVSLEDARVVVISENEYQNLTSQKPNFIEFLLGCEVDLNGVDIEREKSPSRNIDL